MNFRDLGGVASKDGRRVRRGLVFRTGALSHTTTEDASTLVSRFGLTAYFDLRTSFEVEAEGEPRALLAEGVTWHMLPINSFDAGVVMPPLPGEEHWCALYIAFVERFGGTLVDLLDRIAVADAPVVFGCSAGKDRTGVAAASLLACLGVTDANIIEDYATTTRSIEPHLFRFARYWAGDRRRREEFIMGYLRASPSVMERFLAHAKAHWGGLPNALLERGLSKGTIEKLRDRFLEDAVNQ